MKVTEVLISKMVILKLSHTEAFAVQSSREIFTFCEYKTLRMTSFENFHGYKLSRVDSFKRIRRFKLSRVISFQDIEIKKKKKKKKYIYI